MVHFKAIEGTRHYWEEHAEEVPPEKVAEIILTTKNPRKKGNVFEIEKEGYYILFKVENQIAYVINAKRTKK